MKCVLCHNELPVGAVFCPACNTRQPGMAECGEVEYAAFISYRHVPNDQHVAVAVQKAIERYRLPRAVSCGWHAGAGRKLGRVFRDEDELSAVHSLPDRIADALNKSHTLVVVCSPDMRESIWVKREVETFMLLHGRDRVFAVLAGGELENVPDILKSKIIVDANGMLRAVATEPLAADLRPESRARASLEKLRIIASVAGCDFDDLRQRSRNRRRRIVAIAAAALVAVACALGMLGLRAYEERLRAHEEHQRAQLAESYQLAIQSQRLLEQGDRYGAIESALEALPQSDADNRDYAPEAKEALEAALQLHPTNAAWLSCYSIEAESPIGDRIDGSDFYNPSLVDGASRLNSGDLVASDIVANEEEGWFAFVEKNGTVALHDIETGRKIETFQIGEDGKHMSEFQSCDLVIAGNTILLRARDDEKAKIVALGVDSESLTFKWSYDTEASNVTVSDRGQVAVTGLAYGTTLKTWFLSLDDGKVQSEVVAEIEGVAYDTANYKANSGAFDERTGDFYVAFSGVLAREGAETRALGKSDVDTVPLAHQNVGAVECSNGVVIVASYGDGDDGKNIPYAIEAFDSSLKKIWEHTGQYSGTSIVHAGDEGRVIVYGNPGLWGPALNDGSVVAASVGKDVMILDVSTGEALFERTESSTVVGLGPNPQDASKLDEIVLVIATCDGSVMQLMPFYTTGTYHRDFNVALPESIRWAWAGCPKRTRISPLGIGLYAIALSAEDEDKVLVYRSSIIVQTSSEDDREYSLGELRELAHETLEAAGRE